ncbi:HNH endonuclease [Amycolatopsis sp. H20-H5]|uniref:HNH endonuclease n=1 Tax=Amycolatopsis sp. H20-H5 TaxID=3046309 RepID=UPI002DBB164E|nr:HNH endonuclease [Amycolatopsis sp. H20-H5]MEC3975098.1 HNH endonuclease [Amycolatopsis sp. H20-H5]
MSWLKTDDRAAMSAKVRGLHDPGATGERAKEQRCAAIGHWYQILTWVAGERSDGFVTADVVDLFGTKATTTRLLRAKFDRAPLLHKITVNGTPPVCPCLDGRAWPKDYEYAVHDYLDYNPTRTENDVHRAKKRELRDAALKLAARERDADTCRYCAKVCKFSDRTSDNGLTFDHVDPLVADGINNLVVACRGCNRRKGRRTPAEAGMILLDSRPAPTAAPPTTVTSPVTAPDTTTDTTPVATPDTAPRPDQGTAPSPEQQHDQARSRDRVSPGRDGDGPAASTPTHSHDTGSPSPTRPGPPPSRTPHRPASPYLRQSRPFPELHAGHPPRPEDDPPAGSR